MHDAAHQDVRLRAADVDPALYGNGAEAGLFKLDCFASMNAAGLDIDGYVFMSQTYRQIAPLAIGASMRISGHVRRLHAVRRGIVAQELYTFRDDRGRVMLESELSGLLADAPGAAPARTGALVGDRTALPPLGDRLRVDPRALSGSLDYAGSLDGPPPSLWRGREEPGP